VIRRTAVARVAVAAALLVAGCTHAPPATAPKSNPAAERALAADLTKIFAAPAMQNGLWGVEVRSLDSGRVLFSLNAHKLMMPASNMKILTLASAAETLGWDYRFTTYLEAAQPVVDGVLMGNLIVRGTGDPTINTRGNRAAAVFDEWVAGLKAAGISRIAGVIVPDDEVFDRQWLGRGWSWDYLQDGYAAPVGALELNENVVKLTATPRSTAGAQADVTILSPGSGLEILNLAVTGEPGTQSTLDVVRRTDGQVLEVTGSIPAGAPPVMRDIAVVDPSNTFVRGMTAALQARGIAVGRPGDDRFPGLMPEAEPRSQRRIIVQTESAPLREIATVMMKVSQNLYAETLLKAVGASKGAGTVAAGREASRAIFDAWGIPAGTYVQADGSGLSRYDFVTADALVTILEHLFCDPRHHDAFVATLPIAGRDGTISTRMKGTRAEGNATAKTGSIANVRALSGYVRTQDGETLAFSILANSFTIPSATVNAIADQAVVRLADYAR